MSSKMVSTGRDSELRCCHGILINNNSLLPGSSNKPTPSSTATKAKTSLPQTAEDTPCNGRIWCTEAVHLPTRIQNLWVGFGRSCAHFDARTLRTLGNTPLLWSGGMDEGGSTGTVCEARRGLRWTAKRRQSGQDAMGGARETSQEAQGNGRENGYRSQGWRIENLKMNL